MLSSFVTCAVLILGALPGESSYLEGANADREGRHGDAYKAFQRCIELDSVLAPYAAIRQARSRASGGMRNDAAAAYQRAIASYPEGPWTLMARADLASLLTKEQPLLARPHYATVINFNPRPWWMDDLVWDSTRNLLSQSDTKLAGYALLRDRVETTSYTRDRLEASRLLLESENNADRAIALMGILRSGEIAETAKAMRELGQEAWTGGDVSELLKSITMHLRTLDANSTREWLRLALAYTARRQALDGNFDAATANARQLLVLDREHRSAGDAFWWLGWYHASKKRYDLAAQHYEELARTCPRHFRADDALLEAALMWKAAKETESATKALETLIKEYPSSPFLPEVYYLLAQSTDDKKDAEKFLENAAKSGFGNFYGHRAMALLSENPPKGSKPISLNPAESGAILIASRDKHTRIAKWDSSLDKEPRIERLRFFGAHGLEAGRWEALVFANEIESDDPDLFPKYLALAEAGFLHTALRFSDTKSHLQPDERKQLLYPLAYWPQVTRIAKSADIDPFLMLALARQESTFRSTIRSSAGATGVMQLMPATADWLAQVDDAIKPEHAAHLESAENSLLLGAIYIQRMLERSNGALIYALASYNAGPGNCDKWLKSNPSATTDQFIESIPFAETKDYVKKVLGNYAAYLTLYKLDD